MIAKQTVPKQSKEDERMRDEQKTKVRYAEAQADGSKKHYITSETAWNKIVNEVTEANKAAEAKGEAPEAVPELVSSGTFGYRFPISVDEAVALSGGSGTGAYENVDVFLGVFNYAASLRQDNEANDILADPNFQAWEGVKDVSYAVAQKVERAKMTPEERAISALAKGGFKVTADELRAALELIKGNRGEAAGA
jgi:hypothetical protein